MARSGAPEFKLCFPPLCAKYTPPSSPVDISTSSIYVPSMYEAIETSITTALLAWNEIQDPALVATYSRADRMSLLKRVIHEVFPDSEEPSPYVSNICRVIRRLVTSEALQKDTPKGCPLFLPLLGFLAQRAQRPLDPSHTLPPPPLLSPSSRLPTIDDLIVELEVWHPSKGAQKKQRLMCLGRQTLCDVEGALFCPSSSTSHIPTSIPPQGRPHSLNIPTPTPSSSSFFFIGGVFYTQGRDSTVEIRQWIEETEERREKYGVAGPGGAQRKEMSSSRLSDLHFSFGKSYIYQHGTVLCEHVVVFKEMRLANRDDERKEERYPLRRGNRDKKAREKCRVCNLFLAQYVCLGDQVASEDPMFFCGNCFEMAHCNVDGSRKEVECQTFPVYRE
jgi:snRNA-activating protein complex subunit 3